VAGYQQWLVDQGYAPETVRQMLKELGQVGCWLGGEHLEVADLDGARIVQFRADRRDAGFRRVPGCKALAVLERYLHEVGAVPTAPVSTAQLDVVLERYRRWMVEQRGLAETTIVRYEKTARRFLVEQVMTGSVFHPESLTGVDVNAFLLRECARVSAGSAKGCVAELRSLLRFLYLHELTPMRLGSAVPPVGGWRLSTLPPPNIEPADIARLLGSCDRDTTMGRRDFAMMSLIARLGLRCIEVARMQLDDLDWRAGELLVRGKAGRLDRLPLPIDVGEALASYLTERHTLDDRHVFLTERAPRQPIRAELIGDVVQRACLRAGIAHVGPHRLRHALARELLRKGAGLRTIAQVLRHQDLATTALYAKVDMATLREVALPWMGASR